MRITIGRTVLVGLAAIWLAGCGGGGDPQPPAAPASESPAAAESTAPPAAAPTEQSAASAPPAAAASGGAADTYVVCAVCHGENGEGNVALNSPRIAGMEAWYVKRQLEYFRDGLRAPDTSDVYGTQMRAVALTFDSDQEIDDIAAHVEGLNAPAGAKTVTGDTAKGQASYALCTACHGADGKGNAALNTPSVIGQHDWYTVRQTQNYRSGIRGSDARDTFGMQMAPMVKTLADEQAVLDVVAYINTL